MLTVISFLILTFQLSQKALAQDSTAPSAPVCGDIDYIDLYCDSWNPLPAVDPSQTHHPALLFNYGASHLINAIHQTDTALQVIYFAEQTQNPNISDLPAVYVIVYKLERQGKNGYLGIKLTISPLVFSVDIERAIYTDDLNEIQALLKITNIETNFATNYPDILLLIRQTAEFKNLQRFIPSFGSSGSGLPDLGSLGGRPSPLTESLPEEPIYPTNALIQALSLSTHLLKSTTSLKVLYAAIDSYEDLINNNGSIINYIFEVASVDVIWYFAVKCKYTIGEQPTLSIVEAHAGNDLAALTKLVGVVIDPEFVQHYPTAFEDFQANADRLAAISGGTAAAF